MIQNDITAIIASQVAIYPRYTNGVPWNCPAPRPFGIAWCRRVPLDMPLMARVWRPGAAREIGPDGQKRPPFCAKGSEIKIEKFRRSCSLSKWSPDSSNSMIHGDPRGATAHLRKFCGVERQVEPNHTTLPEWKWCSVRMCVSLGMLFVTMIISLAYTPLCLLAWDNQIDPNYCTYIYIYNAYVTLPFWQILVVGQTIHIYVLRYTP